MTTLERPARRGPCFRCGVTWAVCHQLPRCCCDDCDEQDGATHPVLPDVA